MLVCKNCTNDFDGKYCPACGQKASVRRIVTKDLFSDLLKKLLPWDKGFLYTTRRLLTGPGLAVRDYLDGKRVQFAKPLNYLFLVTAVVLLVFNRDLFLRTMTATNPDIDQLPESKQLNDWIFSHMALLMTGIIPFVSIGSKWLFRRSGENFAEHLVMNLYLMAAYMIVYTPVMLVMSVAHVDHLSPVLSLLGIIPFSLFAWGYVQFFRPQPAFGTVMKSIAAFLLGYALYILFISICVVTGILVYTHLIKPFL